MRLFIAVELEDDVKDTLIHVQQSAKTFAKKGRFSRKDQLHLTLRFIGETEKDNLPLIKEALQEAVKGTKSFRLTVDRLGHFQKRSLHVLWAGVQESPALIDLQKNMDRQLERFIGLAPENRPYTPHITLGRNIRFEEDWEEVAESVSVPPVSMDVARATLFHSTQVDGKLQYIPIEHAAF